MILTLIIEFGRQRRKFDFRYPIDINLVENEIKSRFCIEHRYWNDYFIQIYDEEVKDYLDLTSDLFFSTNKHLIKGQMIPSQLNSLQFQGKVSKEQIVGLITLESSEKSLQNWSKLLEQIQLEIRQELQRIRETIVSVKSHYELIDQSNEENLSPIVSNCSSPTSVSHSGNLKFNELIRSIDNNQRNDLSINCFNQEKEKKKEEKSFDYFQCKSIKSNIPINVKYQRFENGVDFQGELSEYYNPTYFFLRICNQKESYDEMHRDINLYYNNIHSNENYFPQLGEFCVAKCSTDSNWYRARIIRLVGKEKVQLIFIDNGQFAQININLIEPLNREFSDRPAQALACTLAQILPFSPNEKCGWNRRACITLENALKNQRLTTGKISLKVTVDHNDQVKWPMMFIKISTETIPNIIDYMCDLYLTRRSSNFEISEFWSFKLCPEQYLFFNLSSLINEKQYFFFNNNSSSKLSFDQKIDLIINDLQFASRTN